MKTITYKANDCDSKPVLYTGTVPDCLINVGLGTLTPTQHNAIDSDRTVDWYYCDMYMERGCNTLYFVYEIEAAENALVEFDKNTEGL